MTDQCTNSDTFPELIDTDDLLRELCDRLAEQSRIAIDTEFVAERTYYPTLGLIQVAGEGICVAIDPMAINDFAPLQQLFASPDITKVFHAAKQDLGIFCDLFGEVPKPLFDTQLGAAFIGYGDQVSYAKLVERVSKVTLKKMGGLTDWTRRPLTPQQLSYALDDVRYLLDVHSNVSSRLERMGRLDWCQEELTALQSGETYARTTPREMYRSVKRWSTLDRKSLAVLRELAAWREESARDRDRPRGRIISDDLLIEIARMAPREERGLSGIRPLNRRERERSGAEIIEAVQRALELPREEWPERPTSRASRGQDVTGLVELLTAYLRSRAEVEQIAPRFVATRDVLERMARHYGNGAADEPLMHGWRRKLIGGELIDILEGRCAITVDHTTGKLKLVPAE